jgi:hypothetical protein
MRTVFVKLMLVPSFFVIVRAARVVVLRFAGFFFDGMAYPR